MRIKILIFVVGLLLLPLLLEAQERIDFIYH